MKKISKIIGLAIFIMSITACGQTKGNESVRSLSIEENTDGVYAANVPMSFEIINNGRMNCSTDAGYYYLSQDMIRLQDNSFASRMMYMDYETKQEIVLCSRPGCTHNTVECPAVFNQNEVSLAGSLFVHEDRLYVFSHEQDQDGVSTVTPQGDTSMMEEGAKSITGTPAVLYQMNLDGTDRKKVFSFDAGLALEDTVLGGGDSLYFITKKLSGEQLDHQTSYVTSTERTLVKVDTGSWESSTVCALENGWRIIGAWEGQLVMDEIVFERELTKEELSDQSAYTNAYKNSTTEYFVFNPADGKKELLVKLSNSRLNTAAVHDGMLYTSTEGEGNIHRTDFKTKKTDMFVTTNGNQILRACDQVLSCCEWPGDSDGPEAAYFIHYADGKIDRSGLVTETMKGRVEVRGELADRFLVIYDIDGRLDTAYDNGQYSVYGYKYALIGKNDFYQGNANYEPIAMIGFGE